MNETKHFQQETYYYTKKKNMRIKREKKETTKHKHTRRDETRRSSLHTSSLHAHIYEREEGGTKKNNNTISFSVI